MARSAVKGFWTASTDPKGPLRVLTEGPCVLPCDNQASSNMLCRHCGATTSAEIDRCEVCHTPNPAPEPAGPRPRPASIRTHLAVERHGVRVRHPLGIRRRRGLQPGQQFGRRYTIIRLLGSGGMARGLSGLGWHARHRGRAEADSRRSPARRHRNGASSKTDSSASSSSRVKSPTRTSSASTISVRSRARSTSRWSMSRERTSRPCSSGSRAAADTSARARAADCVRTRGGASRRNRPSRPEAGQRHGRCPRARAADGFRHRPLDVRRFDAHHARLRRRHARLHGAGAGTWRAG